MFFPELDFQTALKFIRYVGTHVGIGSWDMFAWGIALLYVVMAGDFIARMIRYAGGIFGLAWVSSNRGDMEDMPTLSEVLSEKNDVYKPKYSFGSDSSSMNSDRASSYLSARRK